MKKVEIYFSNKNTETRYFNNESEVRLFLARFCDFEYLDKFVFYRYQYTDLDFREIWELEQIIGKK